MTERYRILPLLGTKTNVPMDDPTLFKPVAETTLLAHDVGGLNVDYQRKRNSVSRAKGRILFSNTPTAEATRCLGLFELYDGSNRDFLYFDNGKIYVYDGSNDPDDITAASVTFANDPGDFYSCVQYGSYILIADRGEHTPYKWKHGDANVSLLINGGGGGNTEYKFRYLEVFQRRIVGAYSDQTNGDIEIRWTAGLPAIAAADVPFPSGNQTYRSSDDPITGMKRMGMNAMFLYGDKSIDRIEYYPNANVPFMMVNMVPHEGAVSHHSIVSTGDKHFFFNARYGFCAYQGTTEFPAGGRPVSEDIENWISDITPAYYPYITGIFVRSQHEICWTVPMFGSTTTNTLLYYNILDGSWRREDKAVRFMDQWGFTSSFTWNDLIAAAGGAGATWAPVGLRTWSAFVSQFYSTVMANTDGNTYYLGSDSDLGAAIIGYRIEPILTFGDRNRKDLLLEIWFGLTQLGNFSIRVWHRSGETEAEVEGSPWVILGDVSCATPQRAILTAIGKMAKLHQITWGTTGIFENFGVNYIDFVIAPQGQY